MDKRQLIELSIELRELFNFLAITDGDIILKKYLQRRYPNACKYVQERSDDDAAMLDKEAVADACLCFDQENDLTQNYN